MYTLAIALFIAIVAGSCIYGKKFWENRINVLGIAAILMLVSLVTVNFISRKSLPVKSEVTEVSRLYSFYVENSDLKDVSCNWLKSTKFEAKDWAPRFQKKIDTTRKLVKKNTYEYTYTYAKQKSAHFLLYVNGKDTMISFVKVKAGVLKVDYHNIDKIKISPVGTGISVPQIQFVSHEYANRTNWAFAGAIPNYDRYYCLYLPKAEYENLPSNIKSRCYLDKKEVYVASL